MAAARVETIDAFLQPLIEDLSAAKAEVHRAANGYTHSPTGRDHPLPFVRSLRPSAVIAAARDLRRLVDDHQIEVVHANSPLVVLAARLAERRTRVRTVCVIHGTPEGRLTRPVYFLIERLASTRRQITVVLNQTDLHTYRRWGFRKERVVLAPCGGMGIDQRFRRVPRPDARRIGWLGRVGAEKRIDLARAVQDELERRGASLRIHAASVPGDRGSDVAGAAEFTDPVAFLADVDLLLSTSSREGFGMTMAEALAMGRPVVATSTNGSRQIGDAVPSGMAIATDDPKDLAEACVSLLGAPVPAVPDAWAQARVVDFHSSLVRGLLP